MEIRDGQDGDRDGLCALISVIFEEYDCIFAMDELPELEAIASYFARAKGGVWVAEDETRIVGCVAFTPSVGEADGLELRKLYVAKAARGTGLGADLALRVESEARARGARFVDLWSDTRFTRAHRFYERRGYVKGPVTRELHDKSNTVEFYFRRAQP